MHEIKADMFVGEQIKQGLVSTGAGVEESAPSIDKTLEETVCDPRHVWMLSEMLAVHFPYGLFSEDSVMVEDPAVEMRNHEASHVRDGAYQRFRRKELHCRFRDRLAAHACRGQ